MLRELVNDSFVSFFSICHSLHVTGSHNEKTNENANEKTPDLISRWATTCRYLVEKVLELYLTTSFLVIQMKKYDIKSSKQQISAQYLGEHT